MVTSADNKIQNHFVQNDKVKDHGLRMGKLSRKRWGAAKIKKERQRQLTIQIEKAKLAGAEKQSKLQAQRQAEKQQKIKQDRLKIEQERQACEVRKIEANKLKDAKQNSKPTTSIADKDELFESDLCSGSAARFRTQCN